MSADKKREAVTGRKRKEQELKYTADIEAGIQNDDFTLKVTKKRRIVKPELRDDSSSNNIGELSRPVRQIETRYKEKHCAHRSGRKKIRKPAERVYKNWKSPFLLDRILRGQGSDTHQRSQQRAVVDGNSRKTFGSLSATTIQAWFDRDNLGRHIWKESALEAAKTNGNSLGHEKRGGRVHW
ncbi:hypothetical protein B0H14DRAFT_2636503 [Mycena olivaceomarginata]|nr:hypothetical protein B0H14DRAFT_2636503 [Mycena olivaceomarginata]